MVERLAPIHCAACHGYHLARARRRLEATSRDALDRDEISRLVRDCLGRLAPGDTVDVLLAGSADTSLLATCAAAASELGGPAARYTVIDRCRTPLALCDAFAARHGLAVRTASIDLGAAEAGDFAADLIVVHSLLRFLPQAAHRAAMRTLRGWLKPGGRIVFSHRLMESGRGDGYLAEYQNAAQLATLFGQAGLRAVSLAEYRDAPDARDPRHRILALLAASAGS